MSASTLPPTIGRHQQHTTLIFWGFVGPLMAGLLVFVYYPILWGTYLSFFNARNTITPQEFVGLANYITMLKDPMFIKSLVTFIIFAACIVPTTLFGALGLAMLVNQARFGRGFFRSVFFIPTACSYVAASLIWRTSIFSGIPAGFANNVMYWLGGDTLAWVGHKTLPLHWVVLVTVRLWLQLGFYMILFLAGMQEIPRSLYEAAKVDGSSAWADFRHITWPLLRNTTVSILLLNLIAAFQAFDEFYNILGSSTGLGNLRLANPPLVYIYLKSFVDQNYGLGSAGAFILVAIIVVFTVIQGRLVGFGKEHY